MRLERAIGADGQQGSFGFSILGGAGTKFPAVVCEVDRQGPADLTEKVRVGVRSACTYNSGRRRRFEEQGDVCLLAGRLYMHVCFCIRNFFLQENM